MKELAGFLGFAVTHPVFLGIGLIACATLLDQKRTCFQSQMFRQTASFAPNEEKAVRTCSLVAVHRKWWSGPPSRYSRSKRSPLPLVCI